jgi:hypothetical protein
MDFIMGDTPPNDLTHKIQVKNGPNVIFYCVSQELGSTFTANVDTCQQQIFSILGDSPLDAQATAKMVWGINILDRYKFICTIR